MKKKKLMQAAEDFSRKQKPSAKINCSLDVYFPHGCRNDEHEDENKTYLGHIGKPESRPRLCKKHFITVLKRKRRMMKGRSSALGRINGRLHHQQLLHASLIPEGGRSVITAAGSLTRALG